MAETPEERKERLAKQNAKFGGFMGVAAQNEHVKKEEERKHKAHAARETKKTEFFSQKNVRERYKQEVQAPHKPFLKGPDVKKRAIYLKNVLGHKLATIVHKVKPDRKARGPQLEALERLVDQAKKGSITDEQMYGGLLHIREEIGKTRFKSRLKETVEELCKELRAENPMLKEKGLQDSFVRKFEAFIGSSPSLVKGNAVLERVKRNFRTEKQSAAAQGRSAMMTEERIAAAKNIIKFHSGKTMISAASSQSFLKETYQSGRKGIKKGLQDRLPGGNKNVRNRQIAELQKTILKLHQDTTLTEPQKAEVLVGTLLKLQDEVRAEKPKNKTHLQKSSLGKMTTKMLDKIGIPENISKERSAELKQQHECFAKGEPVKSVDQKELRRITHKRK